MQDMLPKAAPHGIQVSILHALKENLAAWLLMGQAKPEQRTLTVQMASCLFSQELT